MVLVDEKGLQKTYLLGVGQDRGGLFFFGRTCRVYIYIYIYIYILFRKYTRTYYLIFGTKGKINANHKFPLGIPSILISHILLNIFIHLSFTFPVSFSFSFSLLF